MNSRRLGQPVYLTIETTIRDEIFDGVYQPGDLLPSENDLCAQFNASRETIRKSLKNLENTGFIFSRPGKGYFVSAPQHSRYTVDFQEESGPVKLKNIDVIRPDASILQALKLPEGHRVICVRRLFSSPDGQIHTMEVDYFPYEKGQPVVESAIHYAVFPEMAATKAAPFAFYMRMEISAVASDAEVSRYMECPVGTTMLLVTRYLIGQKGVRIGYSRKYMRQPGQVIVGTSGYLPQEDIATFW